MLKRTRNGKRVQSLLASLGMTMSLGPLLEKLKEGDVVTIFGSKFNRIMYAHTYMLSLLQINQCFVSNVSSNIATKLFSLFNTAHTRTKMSWQST